MYLFWRLLNNKSYFLKWFLLIKKKFLLIPDELQKKKQRAKLSEENDVL